jgi:sialic acid synthase SpsE
MHKLDHDWNICLEMGLNHLGSEKNLFEIVQSIPINYKIAVSIQIREEDFYIKKNKKLHLDIILIKKIEHLFKSKNIKFGYALGPIKDLDYLLKANIKPDFIKLLSISIKDIGFIKKIRSIYKCPFFYSTGLVTEKFIKKKLLFLVRKKDFLNYTALTHHPYGQNLMTISRFLKIHNNISFGVHSSEKFTSCTAIGLGASKIFIYVGNKRKKLPDLEHALDLKEIKEFTNIINNCFSALKQASQVKKILFRG